MTLSEAPGILLRAGWPGEWRSTWAHKPRVISSPQRCSHEDRRTSGHSRRNSPGMAHHVGLSAALQSEVDVWVRASTRPDGRRLLGLQA
jgi:hypothetical protein